MSNEEVRNDVWQIRVDADACPSAVRGSIEKLARRHQIGLIYYIDDSHELSPDYGLVLQIGKGRDAVDLALVNQAVKGDIIVTQDYGLAALALARGAAAIHPGGMLYTEFNIDRLLAERHLAAKARKAGERFSRHNKRKPADDQNFFNQLNELIKGKLAQEGQ